MGEMIAGQVQAVRASGFLNFMGVKQRWFGRGHSPDLAVSLAVRGIEDLNLFLLTGDASPHVEVTQVGCHRVSRALTDLDFLLIWLLAPIVVLSLPAKLFKLSGPAARGETAREP